MKKAFPFLLTMVGIIFVDHACKIITHLKMQPGIAGEIVLIGNWLKLHYLTNPGMAFGLHFGEGFGKLFLTGSRLFIIAGLGYYLWRLIMKDESKWVLICLSLILAGAIGNLIDGIFYGAWLDNAPPYAPTPWGYGQVVDMIFIDIWSGYIPSYIPLIGGKYLSLWPVFNIADATIFISVGLLVFHLIRNKGQTCWDANTKSSESPKDQEYSRN
ncbi:MAG: lipoprotein signal peptidase [Cytophagales bacterium]|nr:lipoprotein signal peptidase [Cytophagales bacterium]